MTTFGCTWLAVVTTGWIKFHMLEYFANFCLKYEAMHVGYIWVYMGRDGGGGGSYAATHKFISFFSQTNTLKGIIVKHYLVQTEFVMTNIRK